MLVVPFNPKHQIKLFVSYFVLVNFLTKVSKYTFSGNEVLFCFSRRNGYKHKTQTSLQINSFETTSSIFLRKYHQIINILCDCMTGDWFFIDPLPGITADHRRNVIHNGTVIWQTCHKSNNIDLNPSSHSWSIQIHFNSVSIMPIFNLWYLH